MSYQQYKSLDKNLIFAEYFNSEQEVRRNGGVPYSSNVYSEGAVKFTGSGNDIINMPLSTYSDEFSSRMRIRIADGETTANYLSDHQWGYWYLLEGGYLRFRVSNTTVLNDASTTISDGEWYDVVGTCKAGQQKIYIDGLEVASDNKAISKSAPIRSVRTFGDDAGPGSNIEHDLELYEEYNKALTAEEVSNLYNDARYVVPELNKVAQGDGVDQNVSDCENDDYDTFTDVSPTGFKASCLGATSHECGTANEIIIVSGQRYLITFDMILNSGNGPSVILRTELGGTTRSNVYQATDGYNIGILTATGTNTGVVDFLSNSVAANFEISNLSVQNLTVEPTKEILNVNAFDGVARNVLSGEINKDLLDSDKGAFENGTDTYTEYPNNVYSIPESGGKIGDKYLQVEYIDTTTMFLYYPHNNGDECIQGLKYRLRFWYKSNGDSVGSTASYLRMNDGGDTITITPAADFIRDGEWHHTDHEFTCGVSTTGVRIWVGGTNTGEVIGIDGIEFLEITPEVTNTDVEVVKEGQVRVMQFKAWTSELSIGVTHTNRNISFLGWVKVEEDIRGTIITHDASDGYKQLLLEWTNSGIYLYTGNGTSYDNVSYAIANNGVMQEFYHFAFTINEQGVRTLYVNGEEVASNTAGYGEVDVDFCITPTTGYRELTGKVSEQRVLEGLLTAEEISQYYTATKHLYGK